jgi:phosphohistidine swiveling domain-containing protein
VPAVVRDVLDGDWDPDAYWSTSNVGEAVPGVLTPLNWSLWERGGEAGLRAALIAVGALERAHADVPAAHRERILALFHGRLAASVDFMGRMGDRLPATSGAAIAEQLLGRLPDDFVSAPTLRRLPIIAVAMPRALTQSPRAVRQLVRDTGPWWTSEVARSPRLDFTGALEQFGAAERWLIHAMGIHTTCVFATIQPFYDVIQRLTTAIDEPRLAQRLLAGQGNHAEVAVVDDLWEVSRRRLDLAGFLARHGYHGPDEGEISGVVWRERPAPVEVLAAQFAAKPESESPVGVLADRAAERRAAEHRLLTALPRPARPVVRFVLDAAARVVPLRGVGKTAYLQAVDVARAASRRLGFHLAEGGTIDAPDDVYMLTIGEVTAAGRGARMQEVVSVRRGQRDAHLRIVLPAGWRGRPDVTSVPESAERRTGLRLEGIGASPGTAEAHVRVVLDAGAGDIEPGEILVAPYTDPSSAPLMFASAGLVVDIGGELSHAAVVARELGIPCVMSTGVGTKWLRDGDRCRIDGDAGTVDVIAEGR